MACSLRNGRLGGKALRKRWQSPQRSADARASPLQTKQDRRRIRELERKLLRKDRALAETAALLVLSDEGVYLASESRLARVLRERGQNVRWGRAKAPKAGRLPTTHIATAPRQVWCWDMTCLAAAVIGRWFHLGRPRVNANLECVRRLATSLK